MPDQPPSPLDGPDGARLQAAVDLVVARRRPDQVVLFGSAVRCAMTEDSDIDLLVVKEGASEDCRDWRWRHPDTDDALDIHVTDPATAERRRRRAGDFHSTALAEGRTLYARRGAHVIPTGPVSAGNGTGMVRQQKLEPDEALYYLRRAGDYLEDASRVQSPGSQCENLQQSMERALKALTIATGNHFRRTHQLDLLLDDLSGIGERVPLACAREDLRRPSLYVGEFQYRRPPDPQIVFARMTPVAAALLAFARQRVPVLIEQTRKELRSDAGS